MRKLTRILAVIALAGAGSIAAAQQAARPLDAQDYFEIDDLIARYAHGFDSGARNGAMWADVFTPDGVFLDGGGREYRGRAAIAQFGSGGPNSRKGPTSVGHFITNIVVEPTPTGAVARSYVMIGGRGRGAGPAASGPPPAPAFGMGGQYRDELVKTEEGWRIKERILLRAGATPDSVRAATPVTNPAATASATPQPGQRQVLSAADYADLLRLNALDPHVTTNVMLIPVSGGVVAKSYRMRVDTGTDGVHIGPAGMTFAYFAKDETGWHQREAFFMDGGSAVPAAARQYVSPSETVTPGSAVTPPSIALMSMPAADVAAIRQLYARTAIDGDERSGVSGRYTFVFNVRIVPTAQGASGEAFVLETLLRPGQPAQVTSAGRTIDELVKAPGGWQFRTRRFTAGLE
jgi:hypothetical protein